MKWTTDFDFLFQWVGGEYKPFWINGSSQKPGDVLQNWIEDLPLRQLKDPPHNYEYRIKMKVEVEEIKISDFEEKPT